MLTRYSNFTERPTLFPIRAQNPGYFQDSLDKVEAPILTPVLNAQSVNHRASLAADRWCLIWLRYRDTRPIPSTASLSTSLSQYI